jgi:hypothetical protein
MSAPTWNHKEQRWMAPGNGRLEAYERREPAQQAIDRDRLTREALGHVRALEGSRLRERVEAALLCYAGTTAASRSLWECIEQAAAHSRYALVQELRALRREATP